jgi:hypothetical protein
MRDLARSLLHTGEPVPVPWPSVGRYLKPRTQSVLVVLAASGVGKSTLALDWVLEHPNPSLYCSFDTALVDHAIRVIARNTNLTTEEIEKGQEQDPAEWAHRYQGYLESLHHKVRFFDQNVKPETIGELVAAETEYWGEAPKLVVVDNLKNLVAAESAAEYRQIVGELLRIAKEHHVLIVALHHLRKKPAKEDDEEDDGTKPVRLRDSLYPVDQDAKYVIGLWREQPWELSISILKNRMGRADANARLRTELIVDLEKSQVKDPERKAA